MNQRLKRSHSIRKQSRWLPLVDRYLLTEILPPFGLSVGIFASLGVAIGYLSDLSHKIVESNLPLWDAAEILLLKIPEFVAYALPISVLLATLMAYGRLGHDSELIAMRSCGVSLYRLVIPGLILSLIVTGITFLFNELVVPEANYRATAILVDSLQEEHTFWQNKDIFYPDYEEIILPNGETQRRLRSLFYAEKFDGQKMKTLTILQWLEDSLEKIVISDAATWNKNQDIWDFFKGTVYQLAPDASYQEAYPFDHRQLAFPKTPFEFALQGRDPYEMNIVQAQKYIKLLKLSGDDKKLLIFQVRTQQKLSFPFICLVFGLAGSVLGAGPHAFSRATSFGLSIVLIFGYYVFSFLMGSLGMVGILTPIMAGWLPILAGLAVGSWLLYYYSQ
ncbi:MAG: LptF/LptG family permease [Microcystaceae cyanobacterium]